MKRSLVNHQLGWMVFDFFIAIFIFSLSLSKATAFFYDQTQINNNYLKVGDWTPPVSTNDITYPLSSWYQQRNITLHINSHDDYNPIVSVALYYSYGPLNDYRFHLYQRKSAAAGDFNPSQDVSLSFNFQAPLGDGHYDLAIVATDSAGNQESLPQVGGAETNLISFDIDTTPPTTALSLGPSDEDRFLSEDKEIDGGFENNDLQGWQSGGLESSHHQIENDPNQAHHGQGMFKLGSNDPDPAIEKDYLEKEYTINQPSWLSFWWRYISEDYIDYDYFNVWLIQGNHQVHLLNYGLDINNPPYDTDWQETSYYLNNQWLNQAFKLRFEMTNSLDNNYPSQVFVDDIRLIPADHHFISTNRQLSLLAKDASGSGVTAIHVCLNGNCQDYQPDLINDSLDLTPLDPGQNQISYWSSDEFGHEEATKSAVIEVKEDNGSGIIDPSDADFNLNIVINQFLANPDPNLGQGQDSDSLPLGEWVELYNRNLSEAIDVNGWYLKDAGNHKIILSSDRTLDNTTIIDPQTSLIFYLNQAILNNNGDTLYLYDDNDNLVDEVKYSSAIEGKSWQRQPDGFGSWMDPEVKNQSKVASNGAKNQSPGASSSASLASHSAELNQSLTMDLTASHSTETKIASHSSQNQHQPKPSPIPTLTPSPSLTPSLSPTPSPSPTASQAAELKIKEKTTDEKN